MHADNLGTNIYGIENDRCLYLRISIIDTKLAVNDNERAGTKTCKHSTVDFFS